MDTIETLPSGSGIRSFGNCRDRMNWSSGVHHSGPCPRDLTMLHHHTTEEPILSIFAASQLSDNPGFSGNIQRYKDELVIQNTRIIEPSFNVGTRGSQSRHLGYAPRRVSEKRGAVQTCVRTSVRGSLLEEADGPASVGVRVSLFALGHSLVTVHRLCLS